jgi:hypothetical protein
VCSSSRFTSMIKLISKLRTLFCKGRIFADRMWSPDKRTQKFYWVGHRAWLTKKNWHAGGPQVNKKQKNKNYTKFCYNRARTQWGKIERKKQHPHTQTNFCQYWHTGGPQVKQKINDFIKNFAH